METSLTRTASRMLPCRSTDPTYKEWKRGGGGVLADRARRRTDPTYKEWKPQHLTKPSKSVPSTDPTYKEWKQILPSSGNKLL